VVEIDLTEQGKELVTQSPEVVQGLLIKGLEPLSDEKLIHISDGLEQLVKILGAKEIPPKLILSTEVNLPHKD
jgi:DNA-binding MarR family transcriptional regulator